ncbi:hypothetical protein [Duganella sp.]|uniref:hypothetical protein n=1 Tax=Duganella sp. TaxID=1904440 RepID=UPI0031D4CCC7
MADATVGALLSALQAPMPAAQPPSSPPAAARKVTPGAGRDLPERRQYRFRLEDVAFD